MLRFRILNEPCSILVRSILLSDKTLIYAGSKALTLYIIYTETTPVKMDAMNVTLWGFCCISQTDLFNNKKFK